MSARPKVRGVAEVGKRLTVVAPRTNHARVRVGYRWLANGRAIPRATRRTLLLRSAHAGKRISVRATVTHAGDLVRTTSTPAARVRRR